MSEDMTFCINKECILKKCARHSKHIKRHDILHSFADLEDTEYCIKTCGEFKLQKSFEKWDKFVDESTSEELIDYEESLGLDYSKYKERDAE